MIILVGSNKGGVGKSTTVINLAVLFASQNKEVLIVDADRQSTVSRWSYDREESKLKPYIQVVQKYDNLEDSLNQLKQKYDIVIVDVAGRNSREMISAMLVADILICPLQCSQPDLDTLAELKEQVIRVIDINKKLKPYIYQTMASTNPTVKDTERDQFVSYVSQFENLKVLHSINYFRKIYKDAMSEGRSIIEHENKGKAANEVLALFDEVNNLLYNK